MLRYATERAEGMLMLSAAGVEVESDLDFAGLHALVQPIAGELGRLPEPQREAVAAALGIAAGLGADRFLVAAGVLSLFAAAADRGPLLCVVDDVQWLDVPSADALVFTARRLRAEGIAVLFATRDGESRRFDAPGLEQVTLAPLESEPALKLLAGSAPDAARHVRERLLAEAAGNPLALLELPAALSREQLAGQQPLPVALPLTERLRVAFMQRIGALPEGARAVLLVAAAEDIGNVRIVKAAATKLGLGPDALDPAEDRGLVTIRGGQLLFRHPLVRAAVYESATRSRRQRVHGALGDVLAADGREDLSLWHRTMATETTDEELAGALEALARQSQLRGGHASAASVFERAAEVGEGGRRRARRLEAAAASAHAAGQVERARGLVERCLPLADRSQQAQLLYRKGLIEGQGTRMHSGVGTLKHAAIVSQKPSLTLEILREACAMAFWSAEYDEAAALGRAAGELVCETDLDRFNATVVMAPAAELSGDHERAAALSAEAIELAERLDDPSPLLWAAMAATREGGPGAGLAYADRAVELARDRSLLSSLPFALATQSAALVTASRFDAAYSASDEGWRLAVDVGSWAVGLNVVNLVLIDAIRGAEESARVRAAELEALVLGSGAALLDGHANRAMGLLELGLGRPAEALDRLLAVVATVRPEANPLFVLGVPDAVEAAARADRLSDVSAHLDRYRAWVERCPTRGRLALLARCRALVDDPAGEHHFAQALADGDALSVFDRGRTELLYGEWLRRKRRRSDARPHLRAALDRFERLAARRWEERARSELRASGETARRREPSTRDQLTPQELHIARLVSTGKSNPEVAAQLFLSPRTIDYHLRKVFVKLDISSRAELARMSLDETIGD